MEIRIWKCLVVCKAMKLEISKKGKEMSPNTSGPALKGLGKRTRRGEWERNRPAECKENQFNGQKAKGRKCIKEEGVLDCTNQFRDMRAEDWPPDLATQPLTIAASPDKSQWVSLRENGRRLEKIKADIFQRALSQAEQRNGLSAEGREDQENSMIFT